MFKQCVSFLESSFVRHHMISERTRLFWSSIQSAYKSIEQERLLFCTGFTGCF